MNINSNDKIFRIGEIYMMQFEGDNNEQVGWRPGLVFQNNTGNNHSPNIIALPLTSANKKRNHKKRNLPTHVFVSKIGTGLIKDSIILCENPQRMSKAKVGRYITTLSNDYMKLVAEASLLSNSIIAYLDEEAVAQIWAKAVTLNSVS